jgi:putative membrane protein
MSVRNLARNLMAGAMLAGVSLSPVQAQPAPAGAEAGTAEREHAAQTARVGALALKTSQIAMQKGMRPDVKEFAGFEVEEQTTIARIIQEMTGMAPPAPDQKAQATLAKLNAASGAGFDQAYLAAQIDGHRELLTIQERYLASGRDPHQRHIAMLARGQIKEHIRLLTDMQRGPRR